MKIKKLIIISFFFLISCNGLLPEPDFVGLTFHIYNNTNVVYDNAYINIGGMKDGEFIKTESYTFPRLTITGTNEWDIYNTNHLRFSTGNVSAEPRWKPDLDLIRNIPSEKAYFKLCLEESVETLLYEIDDNGNLTSLVSREIADGYIFEGDGGSLSIGIWEEGVIGRLYGGNLYLGN